MLVLSPQTKPLLVVLLLWFLVSMLSWPFPAVPHGHFAPARLGNGGAGYRVLGWLLDDVSRARLQTPLEAAGFVSPSAGAPLAPLAHFTALSTLHGVW